MDIEDINIVQGVRQDDIIIAFMGPTGVGKSYFIDLLTGQTGQRAGDSLQSVTAEIQATRVKHSDPKLGNRIVLVDTPGFDDTTKSDMEVLGMINDWLAKTYKRDVKLSGIIYLHRITDNRVAGSAYKNLRMFGQLCGDQATHRVILVSNMWDSLADPAVGEKREQQLRAEFWKGLIGGGSGVGRLGQNTRDLTEKINELTEKGASAEQIVGIQRRKAAIERKEAWPIVEKLARKAMEREVVLLQEETVDLQRRLNETEAGKTLYTGVQKLLADQKETLKSLLAQVEKSGDPKLKKQLEKEYKKLQDQFDKTFKEASKLKVPLGRRLTIFFGKKAHAKSIKIPGIGR